MQDINVFIMDSLKELEIPLYFVARKEVNPPLVVFNVTGEKTYKFWDDQEQLIKYRVSMNLFSKGNFIKYKKQILSLMKKAGFKRIDVPECIYHEDIDTYNQPFLFEIILEADDSEE